ncbi:DUF2986 domain-containing protein [Shewanella sp. OPT22]|nr:DUF2986 domain-containing protein [Shewanella sp. OPT22]
MNKRQKITKKIAKRAKAKQNKVKCGHAADNAKRSGYISKAEREKMEAEQAKVENENTEINNTEE